MPYNWLLWIVFVCPTTIAEAKLNTMIRDCNHLYAHQFTIDCAVQNKCIPCLYKLFPSGVTDVNKYSLVANCRPEQCPRDYRNKCFDAEQKITAKKLENIYRHSTSSCVGKMSTHPWYNGKRILTVGDGDFSFSLSLLKYHRPLTLVATSYESRQSVLNTYKESKATIAELHSLSAAQDVHIFHDVDANALTQCEDLKCWLSSFDVIVWNFPCVKHPTGADAQLEHMTENIDMLKRFFKEAFSFLRPPCRVDGGEVDGGAIHITHKTFEPFCWWELPRIATDTRIAYKCASDDVDNGRSNTDRGSGKKSEHKKSKEKTQKHKSHKSDRKEDEASLATMSYVHSYSMLFDRCLFPGYINRKALDNKSFPLHDAQTFVFSLRKISDGSRDLDAHLTGGTGSACRDVVSHERLLRCMDPSTIELLEASPNVIKGLSSEDTDNKRKKRKVE